MAVLQWVWERQLQAYMLLVHVDVLMRVGTGSFLGLIGVQLDLFSIAEDNGNPEHAHGCG